jgi:hypothetical protein
MAGVQAPSRETSTGEPAPPTATPAARPRRWSARRRFWLGVAAAMVVGLGLRLAIGATDDAPATDETAYLASGISLVEGHGFGKFGRPELHFPPLVPALLGAADEVFDDPHTGTVVLTWLTGTLVLIPVALLGRRVGGPRGGVAAAWVAALAPGLATTPAARGAGSEAEYTLLAMTALWLTVVACDLGGPRREARPRSVRALAAAAGAGLGIGLAYLARPEGLLLGVPMVAALAVAAWRGARRREVAGVRRWAAAVPPLAAFALPLALCIVPYASYLHDHTGRWQLTAKTQDASIEAWRAVASGHREDRDRVLYSPDETGLHFTTERTSLTALARQDPAGYAGILAVNVRELGRNVAGWWLLPLPVWGLAAWGAWRLRRQGAALLVTAVGLVPVATSLAFFVQPRYLVVTTAAAAVLAGAQLAALSTRWFRPVAALTAALLVFGSVGAFVGGGGWWHPVDQTDQQEAGEWLADHSQPGDRFMTRSFVVEYFVGRPAVALPYADLNEIVDFGRHYGVRYMVVDQTSAGRVRPQIEPLLTDDTGAVAEAQGLKLVHESSAEGRTTRIFELDPLPPPSSDTGPGLGFMGDG